MTITLDNILTFVFWTSIFVALTTDVKLFGLCNGGQGRLRTIDQNKWIYCIVLGLLAAYLVPLSSQSVLIASGLMVAGVCAIKEIL